MGAAAGAAVGHAIDPTGGAVTGALGGALIGGAVGNQMDYQDQQIYSQQRQIRPTRPNGYYYDNDPHAG
ncbi:MAG: glycine zipper domain-containing protein [Comamonadaceae bacterium]|nr:glycine zipper domain-containing protein [Comamonadaceae bacterium]